MSCWLRGDGLSAYCFSSKSSTPADNLHSWILWGLKAKWSIVGLFQKITCTLQDPDSGIVTRTSSTSWCPVRTAVLGWQMHSPATAASKNSDKIYGGTEPQCTSARKPCRYMLERRSRIDFLNTVSENIIWRVVGEALRLIGHSYHPWQKHHDQGLTFYKS